MPAEFQKAIDCTLAGLTNTFCFLDNLLIVSRGRIEYHLDLFRKILIKLDQENVRIKLAKGHFAKDEIEWLGSSINRTGITSLSNKIDDIANLFFNLKSQRIAIFYGISTSSRKIYAKFISNVSPI